MPPTSERHWHKFITTKQQQKFNSHPFDMHATLSIFILSILSVGTSVLAIPQNRDEHLKTQPLRRDSDTEEVDGHILLCTDYDFAGECVSYGFFNNDCSDFPWGLESDISSVAPDQGWICTLYIDQNCVTTAGILEVQYPGISELSFGNDELSSLSCFRINE